MSRPGNWLEYFQGKFADATLYNAEHDEAETTVKDASRQSQTEIIIKYSLDYDDVGERYSQLHDVLFINPASPGWERAQWVQHRFGLDDSSEFPGDTASIDEWLDIPLHRGWSETLFFLDGEHLKSEVVWEHNGQEVRQTIHMDDVGCFVALYRSLIYYPFLAKTRLETRKVQIPPMVDPSQQE